MSFLFLVFGCPFSRVFCRQNTGVWFLRVSFFCSPPGFLVQTTGVNKASGESSPSAWIVPRQEPRRWSTPFRDPILVAEFAQIFGRRFRLDWLMFTGQVELPEGGHRISLRLRGKLQAQQGAQDARGR